MLHDQTWDGYNREKVTAVRLFAIKYQEGVGLRDLYGVGPTLAALSSFLNLKLPLCQGKHERSGRIFLDEA